MDFHLVTSRETNSSSFTEIVVLVIVLVIVLVTLDWFVMLVDDSSVDVEEFSLSLLFYVPVEVRRSYHRSVCESISEV